MHPLIPLHHQEDSISGEQNQSLTRY